MNGKIAPSALFVFWFMALAGSAQAEYIYDCKVDWICQGPNLCEKSGEMIELSHGDDWLLLNVATESDVEDLDLKKVAGDSYYGSIFSGIDSDGNLTVLSVDSIGNALITTHRKARGNSFFTDTGRILTSYLTCKWRP